MNRSNGAYAPLRFHDFCIAIDLPGVGCAQEVIRETSPKRALGRAYGALRAEGFEAGKVRFCKRADDMSREDRFMWGVETPADIAADQAQQRAARAGEPFINHWG